MAHRETADLLYCNDLVDIMRHKLPSKIQTDVNLIAFIEDRHRRRQYAKNFAYQKQASILSHQLAMKSDKVEISNSDHRKP